MHHRIIIIIIINTNTVLFVPIHHKHVVKEISKVIGQNYTIITVIVLIPNERHQ